jgi:hypothetical protein
MGADGFVIDVPLNQALFGFGDAVCVPVIGWIAKNYLNNLVDEMWGHLNTLQSRITSSGSDAVYAVASSSELAPKRTGDPRTYGKGKAC